MNSSTHTALATCFLTLSAFGADRPDVCGFDYDAVGSFDAETGAALSLRSAWRFRTEVTASIKSALLHERSLPCPPSTFPRVTVLSGLPAYSRALAPLARHF